jgi:putative SOS response-associated peptidase YedK
MCGRAVQTVGVAVNAARRFGVSPSNASSSSSSAMHSSSSSSPAEEQSHDTTTKLDDIPRDNFNMSPGMDAIVIYMEDGKLKLDKKKWGLIYRNGSHQKPLFHDKKEIISMCFSNLCYNARSDTLYSKPTFSNLAHRGRACVVAFDGYFEWKSSPLPKSKGKQPYFVYKKQQQQQEDLPSETQQRDPLLMAGLWTRVSTGHEDCPELDSFTILTTESCKQIQWLHHRMPLCIWDLNLAQKWLSQPSEKLMNQLDDAARLNNEGFAWHKVTPEMSKLSFRGKESIIEMKETIRSVKDFFSSAAKKDITPQVDEKLPSFETKDLLHRTKVTDEKAADSKVSTSKIASSSSINTNNTKKRPLDSFVKTEVGLATTTKKINPPLSDKKLTLSTTTAFFSPKTSNKKGRNTPPNSNQRSITSFFQQKK